MLGYGVARAMCVVPPASGMEASTTSPDAVDANPKSPSADRNEFVSGAPWISRTFTGGSCEYSPW